MSETDTEAGYLDSEGFSFPPRYYQQAVISYHLNARTNTTCPFNSAQHQPTRSNVKGLKQSSTGILLGPDSEDRFYKTQVTKACINNFSSSYSQEKSFWTSKFLLCIGTQIFTHRIENTVSVAYVSLS